MNEIVKTQVLAAILHEMPDNIEVSVVRNVTSAALRHVDAALHLERERIGEAVRNLLLMLERDQTPPTYAQRVELITRIQQGAFAFGADNIER